MRTYVRVRREALAANFRSIVNFVGPGVSVLAVIKADAYGHGAVETARALEAAGCGRFAVACLAEGLELREAGNDREIVLLGGLQSGEESQARDARLTPLIHSACQIDRWNEQAVQGGRSLPYHLQINTGMNRFGLEPDVDQVASAVAGAQHIELKGLATHLASAEDFTDSQTAEQLDQFHQLVRGLADRGIEPRYLHAANSAAVAYRSDAHMTMVRPGLALFGYVSEAVGAVPKPGFTLQPALEWKAQVAAIREVDPGARLGYNGAFRAESAMKIAVLAAGYGDGLSRRLSNGGEVLVRGRRCPIVGLVSMDVTIVDVTCVGEEGVGEEAVGAAEVGDEATLIGPTLDAAEMAARRGTIPYEVLCGISKRVPRLYC